MVQLKSLLDSRADQVFRQLFSRIDKYQKKTFKVAQAVAL